jgi:uncharacterized OB-fold protein
MTKTVEFQRTCPHKNGTIEVTTWDENYSKEINPSSGHKGRNIFMGRECPDCGKFFPRRSGPPHEICYNCGGNMKEESRHEYNREQIIVTKCDKCNHTYEIREKDLNNKMP